MDNLNLQAMDAAQLREFAKARGIKVTTLPNVRAETLAKQIQEAIAADPALAEAQPAEAAAEPAVPAEAAAEPAPAGSGDAPDNPVAADDAAVDVEAAAPVEPPVETPAAEAQPAEAAQEHDLDPVIRFEHPDGGSSDSYPVDEDGYLLARASQAHELASHGFIPAAARKE